MYKTITGNQKHMTLDDRIFIEKGLEQQHSLRSIALQLGKDPTTISKGIKKHRSFQEHNHFNEPKNKCADPVITATRIVRILFLAVTIAASWIRLPLSAMAA